MTGPFGGVTLSCEAKIGDQKVTVREHILEVVYNDPEARKTVEWLLRRKLMDAILEKWTPVVKVTR